MKGVKKPLGYTILEVLIVLAVSGVMFLIASNFINGKQQKTSFLTATNEFASRIQDSINSVTDGQYSDYPVTCSYSGGTWSFSTETDTTKLNNGGTQGKNDQCVFLGKIIHFSVAGDNNIYETFSIVGLRALGDDSPTTIADADPAVITNLTTTSNAPQSLDVIKSTVVDSSGTSQSSYAFGFLQSPSSGVETGTRQPPQLYFVNNIPNDNKPSLAAANNINKTSIDLAKSASICVSDGTRRALVKIGFNNSKQNVKVVYLGSTSCP